MDDQKKTIEHLFYITSGFVHHFKAMSEFKQVLQSETLNSGPIRQFFTRVTLKFDRWLWKTIGHLFCTT